MLKSNVDLTDEQKQGVIELLNSDLANLSLLLLKTQKSYWNAVGSQFRILHQLWEEEYETLTKKIEQTAARIQALGGNPIVTVEKILKYSTVKESTDNFSNVFAISAINDQ